MKFICVVAVWETPVDPLSTLSILRFLNTSNIDKVSPPIVMLLPIDTVSGSWEMYTSVTTPTVDAGISWATFE